MALEVAGTCMHCSRSLLTRGPPSSKNVAHVISSVLHPASRNSLDHPITLYSTHRSRLLGTAFIQHFHLRERTKGGRRRASSCASLDGFVDGGQNEKEQLDNSFDNLTLAFEIQAESIRNQQAETSNSCDESVPSPSFEEIHSIPPTSDSISPIAISKNPEIPAMPPEPWSGSDEFELENVQRRANSFDLPLSLRILKRKKMRLESAEMTDSVCSSVKKAFSYMVFIVRELQSHAIRLREALFSSKNFQIQGVLARVHGELHSSFVWLFQSIFSATPTLMVSLMLLLANFTVFSITDYHAAAAPLLPPPSVSAVTEEFQNTNPRLDFFSIKTFSVGRSDVGGGSGSGRGKPPTIAGAADDGLPDWQSSSTGYGSTIFPGAMPTAAMGEETAASVWKRIVEESEMIRASVRHEALMDSDILLRFVSPVTVEPEPDDFSAYSLTELSYLRALAENPDDALILSNFAQFLFTVLRNHDRAEEYFKRAARAEPADAETLCRYANFLWVARNDLPAAEETFLEAISAEPGNSYYSANYAHFLWSTGGEDTCYPLDDCDSSC